MGGQNPIFFRGFHLRTRAPAHPRPPGFSLLYSGGATTNFGGWLGLSTQDGTFGDSQRHGTRDSPTGLSLPQNDAGSRSGIVHARRRRIASRTWWTPTNSKSGSRKAKPTGNAVLAGWRPDYLPVVLAAEPSAHATRSSTCTACRPLPLLGTAHRRQWADAWTDRSQQRVRRFRAGLSRERDDRAGLAPDGRRTISSVTCTRPCDGRTERSCPTRITARAPISGSAHARLGAIRTR